MFIKHHLKTIGFLLFIGFMVSTIVFSILHQWELSKNQDKIIFRSDHRLTAMKNTFDDMIETTAYLNDFILAELNTENNDALTTHEFTLYANTLLSRHQKKGMLSLIWQPNTLVNGSVLSPPLQTKLSSLSLDNTSLNSSLKKYIEKIDGQQSLTIDITKDEYSQYIINIFLPVFPSSLTTDKKAVLLGYVVSQWRIDQAIEYATKQLPVSGLHFFLLDEQNIPIHTHKSRSFKDALTTEIKKPVWQKTFNIGQHAWTLTTSPAPAFTKENPATLSYVVLAFGILLTLGLARYIFIILKKQEDIEDEVRNRTKDLTESEYSLAKAQEITHLGSWTWFIPARKLHWSDQTFYIFGCNPESFEPTLDYLNRVSHPDDRKVVKQALRGALQGKPYDFKHRIILPNQTVRIVHERGTLEFDSNNQPLKMNGTIQDITEQTKAENKLHRLHMALAETAESIIITNKKGYIRYVNKAFESISGYTSKEVLDKKPSIVSSGQHPTSYYQQMWEKISRGTPWLGTFTNRAKDGHLYLVQQTISPIHNQKGEVNGYVAVQRDITLEEKQRKQMEHTQRLESLGVLAGGIAHDFNNLLTSILGNASLIDKKYQANQPIDKHIQNIVTASKHAADLCQQMLAYSGQGAYHMDWLDLPKIIREMNELLQVSLHHKTSIEIETNVVDAWLYADTSQIQQVVMNLVINASEATSNNQSHGKITIQTYCKHMQAKDFHSCFNADELGSGDYICLRVEDNGCGMDAETKAKIFDPFFTTKFSGRGLGMSAVLGIIQAHKGAVKLTTKHHIGTVFEVFFPCSSNHPNQEEKDNTQPLELPKNESLITTKTILVIDDEDFILETATAMLEDDGYTVIAAISPEQGIDDFKKHQNEIDITIIDMTMPQMDGITCATKIRALDNNAVIILSSGYSDQIISDNKHGISLNGFLQKPYSAETLLKQVERTLTPK